MKRFVALLLFCISLITNAQSVENDIIGKWKATNPDGVNAYFIFDKDGFAYMGDDTMMIGGKEFEMDGEKVNLTYSMNKTVSPMHLDLLVTSLLSNEMMNFPMIFEFVDKDHLRLFGNDENKRPTAFTDRALVFERVE